jgi:hypothetical protein
MSHHANCDQDPNHSHEEEKAEQEKHAPAGETKAGLKK